MSEQRSESKPACDKCGAVACVFVGKEASVRVAACASHSGWAHRRFARNQKRASVGSGADAA